MINQETYHRIRISGTGMNNTRLTYRDIPEAESDRARAIQREAVMNKVAVSIFVSTS